MAGRTSYNSLFVKAGFWTAVGIIVVMMLFPFSALDITGMQTAQYVHAIAGMVLIAIIIAHIYIGTLGMEGAYQAMRTGEVDLAWARTHHSLWVEEQQRKYRTDGRGTATAPAE